MFVLLFNVVNTDLNICNANDNATLQIGIKLHFVSNIQ
jgi:hypothetical protein